MAYQNFRQWTAALDRASASFRARHGLSNEDVYRLRTKTCRKHGAKCVCVVFGEILQHFRWDSADPGETAASLLQTMLPEPSVGGRRRRTAIA